MLVSMPLKKLLHLITFIKKKKKKEGLKLFFLINLIGRSILVTMNTYNGMQKHH